MCCRGHGSLYRARTIACSISLLIVSVKMLAAHRIFAGVFKIMILLFIVVFARCTVDSTYLRLVVLTFFTVNYPGM